MLTAGKKAPYTETNSGRMREFFFLLNLGLVATAAGIALFQNAQPFCVWRHVGPVHCAGDALPAI